MGEPIDDPRVRLRAIAREARSIQVRAISESRPMTDDEKMRIGELLREQERIEQEQIGRESP